MRTAAIKPDIKNICDLLPAIIILWHEILKRGFKPAVNALLCDLGEDTRINGIGVLAVCMKRTVRANNQRDRHAPIPLAGNQPVRTIRHHRREAVTPAFGIKRRFFNRAHSRLAQPAATHGDKPLRRCAANNRGFGTPAMGIAQSHNSACKQVPAFNKRL